MDTIKGYEKKCCMKLKEGKTSWFPRKSLVEMKKEIKNNWEKYTYKICVYAHIAVYSNYIFK